jgi:hypothetical protein
MIEIRTYFAPGPGQSRHTVWDRADMQYSWQRAIDLLGADDFAVLLWNGHEIERHVNQVVLRAA